MQLVPRSGFGDLDRFFDDQNWFPFGPEATQPALDLYEDDNAVTAELSLPGIDPKNIDVSVEHGVLRVSGSQEEETEDTQKDYWRKEIRKGAFERAVRVPTPVDENNVEAKYEDGVLRVTMPKQQSGGSRKKIEVKTS